MTDTDRIAAARAHGYATVPEDDRPVGEVPPRLNTAAIKTPGFALKPPMTNAASMPDTYQALLTQLHEAREEVARLRGYLTARDAEAAHERAGRWKDRAVSAEAREAALRAGIEGLAAEGEAWGLGVARELSRRLRALLDGEARP